MVQGAPVVIGLSAALALLASTALVVKDFDYGEQGYRRCRTDQTAAIGSYLERAFPHSLPGLGGAPHEPMIDSYYHEVLVGRIRALGLRPWKLWATVPERPFLRVQGETQVPAYDDPGRAWLLGLGFRLLGGIAPFLVFWVAPLMMSLVLGWAGAEAAAAGHTPAALVFALLFVASPFLIETLALTRSPVGFHLVALVLLLPLAFAARRHPAPGWPAWFARVAPAGALFAVCAVCRGGVLLLLPAFAAVLAVGCARAGSGPLPHARRAVGWLAAGALLLGPYLLVRPSSRHEAWAGIWEGLGDFDRTKGHTWADRAAAERVWQLQGRRGVMPRPGGDALVAWLSRPEAGAVLRRDVLDHVLGDPAWFAGILARRTFATLTLQRLWPMASLDGQAVLPAGSSADGYINKYWGYTTTADFVGFGSAQVELPVSLLFAPTVLLLGWLIGQRSRGRSAGQDAPFLLGVLLLGALAVPVTITTASGSEPQAIVLVHFLGAGFLAEVVWRRRRAEAPLGRAAG